MSEVSIKAKRRGAMDNGASYRGTYRGYYFEAKLLDGGCDQGLNGSAFSKLSICRGDHWDVRKQKFNFDSGADYSKLDPGFVEELVKKLELELDAPPRRDEEDVPEYCWVTSPNKESAQLGVGS